MVKQQQQTTTPDLTGPDAEKLSSSIAEIAKRSQQLINDFIARQGTEDSMDELRSASNIGQAFLEMTAAMMKNPAKLAEAQASLWNDYLKLWLSAAGRMTGAETEPVIEPAPGDRRFRDQAWSGNEVFDYLKQSYLLTANWLQDTVRGVEGLDDKTAKKVDFYTRQYVDAMSPSNFAATNPEVIRTTIGTGGENLIEGLNNLLGDLERGHGKLKISMTDDEAFEIGVNIATTAGKVIYRNDLVEIIQYAPTTDKVFETPLLIITPWINKYYVLDLRPENSMIKWIVDQGYTVFITSWINPDRELAEKTFEDYMFEGIIKPLEAIEKATGERQINTIGYCIGGTLMAAALAYMAAKNDSRIKAATFLASMVDFSDPGELGIFVDREQLADLEQRMNERGYLEGFKMANTFNMMRDNDLIWSFVINNYLLGKDPFPFDLLYWNSDSTRMPAAMHSFYLRNMYLENKLAQPGGISLGGVDIDLRAIDLPVYILSARDDHIAPWKSTYAATGLYHGPTRFVLTASGHVAGVVNPPARGKYCFWSYAKLPEDADNWLAKAKRHEGSWWPDWNRWIKRHAGKKTIPARRPGDGKLKALADAPGTYVKRRSDDYSK